MPIDPSTKNHGFAVIGLFVVVMVATFGLAYLLDWAFPSRPSSSFSSSKDSQ